MGHNKNAKLPMSKMFLHPELGVNPFRDRICKIFSSSHDGDCTFEDFLDMMSVFSENAPLSVKAEHAFRIYGKYISTVDVSNGNAVRILGLDKLLFIQFSLIRF